MAAVKKRHASFHLPNCMLRKSFFGPLQQPDCAEGATSPPSLLRWEFLKADPELSRSGNASCSCTALLWWIGVKNNSRWCEALLCICEYSIASRLVSSPVQALEVKGKGRALADVSQLRIILRETISCWKQGSISMALRCFTPQTCQLYMYTA